MGPEQLNQLLEVGVAHGATDIHFVRVPSPTGGYGCVGVIVQYP